MGPQNPILIIKALILLNPKPSDVIWARDQGRGGGWLSGIASVEPKVRFRFGVFLKMNWGLGVTSEGPYNPGPTLALKCPFSCLLFHACSF